MIERILIKDSIIFSQAEIRPSNGFNVFSGASGAGKSVLMENILAIFGLKDSNCALLEANLNACVDVNECGILNQDEINISICKKDKIKYFLNNQSISKKKIKELFGDYVKYINSHSTAELNDSNLLFTLDLIACKNNKDFKNLLDDFRVKFRESLRLKNELEHLIQKEQNIIELREFARFEINQIESINPQISEYDELLELKKTLSKKEKTLEKIASLKPALEHFGNIIGFLESLEKNKEIFSDVLNEIETIINDEEERLANIDEREIEGILNRLEILGNLVHKYGSIEGALEYLKKRKIDMESYENISFEKEKLQNSLNEIIEKLQYLAREMTKTRTKTLEIFKQKLESYCKNLMLNKPNIALQSCQMNENGCDILDLKLKDSAICNLSSGEFNRLKLAILCIEIEFSAQSGIIILDEIDANLSGSESEGVALALNLLAKNYQIFAISHQSHMPVFADNHFVITKNKNKSSIKLLDKAGRIDEIARMISGAQISDEARLFAKEKLKHLQA